jgi:hypothetical protein
MSKDKYPSDNKDILSEKDISNINILAEIKEDDKNILSEEDILDINTPAEIEKENKKKDMEI